MSDKDKGKKMPDPSESANDRIPVERALEKNAATEADTEPLPGDYEGQPPESRAEEPPYAAPADLRNAYEESSGTIAEPYTVSSREMYVDRMKANLDERGIDVKTLMSRAEGTDATVQTVFLQQLESIRGLQETAARALQAVAESGGSAWQTVAGAADKAYEDLRAAVESAMSRFRGKSQAPPEE